MIVVFAEKPSQAKDYAFVLGAKDRKDGYFLGNGYAVIWAFGHLVEICRPAEQNPVWKNPGPDLLPLVPDEWQFKVSDDKKKQFGIVKKLFNSNNTTEIICATDAGREGEHIFRLVYMQTGCTKPIKRLWVSSLTPEAIREGFARLQPGQKFDALAAAAMSRAKADWLVGLNFSIAYSIHNGMRISTGRVQTPTLAMIVGRELEILNFVKSKYYEIHGDAQAGFIAKCVNSQAKDGKYIFDKDLAAQIAQDLVDLPPGEISKKESKQGKSKAPALFNLLALQKECNSLFGFTAAKTLQVAQALYEKHKLTSYPRTESRHLSTDMVPKLPNILGGLPGEYQSFVEQAKRRLSGGLKLSKSYVDDAKLTDHHAIIPTGKRPGDGLSDDEKNVYLLICEQFLGIFLPECITEKTSLDIAVKNYVFQTFGTITLDPGWKKALRVKKTASDGEPLPDLNQGDVVDWKSITSIEKETKPPARYNDSSLLTAMKTAGKNLDDDALVDAMKENGIGTPATRSGIIEKLFKIGYCRREKKSIIPTQFGMDRIAGEIPELKSPEMTGKWETRLKQIEGGQADASQFDQDIISFCYKLLPTVFNSSKLEKENFGKCPVCGQGVIIEGKKGFGCDKWKEGCSFVIWKKVAGKTLSQVQIKQLLENGRTRKIKGFKSKTGKSFDAILELKDGKVEFCFDSPAPGGSGDNTSGPACPICGQGSIIDGKKGYGCSRWKDGCKFTIWKKIAGKTIPKGQVEKLLKTGKSDKIKGFKSKAGKPFDAVLKIEGGQVKFDF